MICTMIWYEKRERAGWDTCVNIRVGCELLRMRPLRSSDRRRVSLVCRNSLKSVATKPNLRRKRFPSVSVKNFISPSAFGLWWNNYFHPDLWVALQKILHFLHPTATQGRTTKNTQFLSRAGWEHPRRKCIPPHSWRLWWLCWKLTSSQVEK